MCRRTLDGNFLIMIDGRRDTLPFDMVKKKWMENGSFDKNCRRQKKPPAGRKTRLGGLGTFDTECRKCFCVTFDKSNKNLWLRAAPLGLLLAQRYIVIEKLIGGIYHEQIITDKEKMEGGCCLWNEPSVHQ